MRSHSVTCYPTQVNAPRPSPARKRVLDLPLRDGRLSWLIATRQCNGRESNWRSLDHKSDDLTTEPPTGTQPRVEVAGALFTNTTASQDVSPVTVQTDASAAVAEWRHCCDVISGCELMRKATLRCVCVVSVCHHLSQRCRRSRRSTALHPGTHLMGRGGDKLGSKWGYAPMDGC